MCGLIGYSGEDNYNLDKIKFLMLWNSIERGKNATGIYTPSSGLMKDNEPAAKFFSGKEMKLLKDDNQLIAHVRASTVGANMARNAHPFDTENIVLAHNGTLVDYSALASSYGMLPKDWDVDSQILAYGVNRAFTEGVTLDTLKVDTFSEYRGAAAMLFYSKTLDMMFVFKDAERTLYYGYDIEGGMYISSLAEALNAIEVYEIQAFENNTLYGISHGEIVKKEVYKIYTELHKEEYNGKVRGREKGQRFPKLKKEDKRIDTAGDSFKSYWFMNLWLLCDTQQWGYSNVKGTYSRRATLKVGKYYLVTGWYAEKVRVVEVMGEDGAKGEAPLHCFNLNECIPYVGQLFRLRWQITKSKRKDQILWEKGEVAQVSKLGYSIEYGTISLWNEKEEEAFDLNLEYCEPLSDNETLEYWTANSDDDKDTSKIEQPEEDISEAEVVSETPFIDSYSEEVEHSLLESPKIDDMIDSRIYLGVLDLMENELNKIEEDYNADLDLTPKFNDLRSKISVSKDPVYLNTLVLQE